MIRAILLSGAILTSSAAFAPSAEAGDLRFIFGLGDRHGNSVRVTVGSRKDRVHRHRGHSHRERVIRHRHHRPAPRCRTITTRVWVPGHVQLMNFFFHELLMRDRRKEAGEILVHAKPPVDDDIVYIHVSAEGTKDNALARHEFVRGYRPIELAGKQRTAIAWTTASSVVAVIEMVRDGKLPGSGFLKQEDVPLDGFLQTATGSAYASNG